MKNLRVEPRPYLAMGKGPHHKNNRVAARYQLSHITNSWGGKRSANFHTPNWEVIWHWILNYLKKKRKMSPRNILRTLPPTSRCQYLTFKSFWGPSAARTLSLCKSWTRAEKKKLRARQRTHFCPSNLTRKTHRWGGLHMSVTSTLYF